MCPLARREMVVAGSYLQVTEGSKEDLMHATADAATCPGDTFEEQALPHAPQLYAVALRLTHQHCDAEDLVQDTLARAYAKFYQFTPGTNLGGWLYRILLSTFYSGCRQRSRRPAEVLTAEEEAGGRAAPAPAAKSAEAEALGRLGDSAIVRALAALPGVYKAVIYLADVEGYQYAEIADLLNIPVGTVMSRIHRGRAMLRAKLSSNGPAGVAHQNRPAFPAAVKDGARLAA
jgi:RNA polymerase sigma-70 factor, ECF subfamily